MATTHERLLRRVCLTYLSAVRPGAEECAELSRVQARRRLTDTRRLRPGRLSCLPTHPLPFRGQGLMARVMYRNMISRVRSATKLFFFFSQLIDDT